MAYRNLSPVVTERADALVLLEAIREGVPDTEFAPFVRAMTSHDDEQTFAIMRGSGNEMSLPTQLASLLEGAGLITMEEAIEAAVAGRRAREGAAA
ncbi:hypothetical protein [Methylorubrum thiocyanatum]|uniref:hypothetical protein n=1 Tax=Methylorubrum thiocyanatum TaxID=47958 RepID=UPI003F7FE606